MNATHAENIETIRCALMADENRIQADAIKADAIMAAARADAEKAAELAAAIPHEWPETEEEVEENARTLWRMR